MNTLEKLAILTEVRMLHALDGRFTHSWKERAALIVKDKMAQKTYQSYPNYPDEKDSRVKEFCKQAHSHLALFKKKKGSCARDWVLEAEKMPAYQWWDLNCSSLP